MRRLSFLLVALLALGGLLHADELTTGTLEGTVTDKDGTEIGRLVSALAKHHRARPMLAGS